jgi:hypothetical protein
MWRDGRATTFILTKTLDGGQWSASHPDRLTPQKITWYSLNRKLGRSQSRFWCSPLPGIELRFPGCLARSLVITPTTLSQLPNRVKRQHKLFTQLKITCSKIEQNLVLTQEMQLTDVTCYVVLCCVTAVLRCKIRHNCCVNRTDTV